MKPRRFTTVMGVLAGCAVLTGNMAAFAGQSRSPLNFADIPDRYANQMLDWHSCSAGELPPALPEISAGLECATFRTPRDWYRPDDRIDFTIAASRLKSTSDTTASLLVNPGGPGAPGRLFPARLRHQSKLREHQEIVGFDPRGTGKSTNISCGGAIGTGSTLDPRERGRENLTMILDATDYAVQACQAKAAGLGAMISTEQTVRDIDLLRVLLKREKVNWVGYSGGTWLGAHYAQAFPDRAGRFVLDSNTEFTTTWQKSFAWQPLGFERRWREDFLPWLASYDGLYHFGNTGEDARQTYEQIRYVLSRNPVQANGMTWSASLLDASIVTDLYGKRDFPDLAKRLVNVRTVVEAGSSAEERAAALRELGTVGRAAVTGPQPLVVPGDYDDAYNASFWTIPCNEGPWTGNRQTVISESAEAGARYPLLGWGWLIQPCIFWDNQPAPLPVLNGAGVPPVLMVQSTHDPATPIEGALRAHQAFQGSRLITVTGEGDHGIYAGGNTAVDKVVEDYLVDGIVPADQTLPGLPLPVPTGA